MDAKTFEYMNERVKKYNDAKDKIKKLKDRIGFMERFEFKDAYFVVGNTNYQDIPYVDKQLLKETLLKLMNDKIEIIEKEQSEI